MSRTDYTLKSDAEFRQLVAPPTPAEQISLEEEILSPDRSRRILIWNGAILVDYTYYEYCELLQLPYDTISLPCNTREEAVAWICNNQLKRTELTTEMRRYLIGKWSEAEILLTAKKHRQPNGRPEIGNSQFAARNRIGTENRIAATTVWKYENYAKALDSMRQIVPETIEAHLAGQFKISLERADVMSKLSPEKLRDECQQIIAEIQLDTPTTWKKRLLSDDTPPHAEAKKKRTIKDMPEYDPDSEISSLALTIPSWISTISRVNRVTDITKTSPAARIRLREELKLLKRTANTMLRKVKEN